ncbi:formylglycine-generating enzyme family protein [Frankia sp. Cas4]|uniref:formylglycine-generating enzyme family protein n=1 Tax=Frankia sp. Cas4 TaxID=3073927 RepID=UPI002AD4AE39|nr:SUMF1/EgtB/PvdO family nonheme iron enzyme [Frankia sp. Cas4]
MGNGSPHRSPSIASRGTGTPAPSVATQHQGDSLLRLAIYPPQPRYPWGDQEWTPARANLRGSRYGQPTPVDLHPAGATPDGLRDVAGNVWEWTSTPVLGDGSVIRGGSYRSLPLYARGKFLNAAPRDRASAGIGGHRRASAGIDVRVVWDL